MPEAATAATADLAAVLARAWTERRPVPPPSAAAPGLDLAAAYAAQDELVRLLDAWGLRRRGYKAGATSVASQRQLGLERPIFGRVLRREAAGTGAVRLSERIAPRAEPEVALLLGRTVDRPGPEAVRAATDSLHVALEIADTRIVAWSGNAVDLAADCAAAGEFAIGPPLDPGACGEADALEVAMAVDGEPAGAGRSSSLAGGGPYAVAAELAAWCAERGAPLGAGDVILTGALATPVELRAGARVRAASAALGEVEVAVE